MFRDRPSISLGPIGVGLSSLTRRKCCGLLMLAPIGMVVPSLRATTGPIQENADRAEDDQRALKDFLEAYHLAPGQILERVPRLGQKASGRGGNISILTTGTSLTNSGLWSSVGAIRINSTIGAAPPVRASHSANSSDISKRTYTSSISTVTASCLIRSSAATGFIVMAWTSSGWFTRSR